MYLEANLARLNSSFNSKGLEFKKEKNNIRIIEKKAYLFNEFTTLKNILEKNFNVTYNSNMLWHFDSLGIEKLSSKKLKWEPTKDIAELVIDFNKHLESLDETILRDSMKSFFKNNKYFFKAPAAMSYHHAYVGGLLEHSVQTTNMALALRDNFLEDMNINEDLVIAGAILHDVGKINCYQLNGDIIGKTRIYDIQYHIVNGIKIVSQNIVCSKLDDIIHIIASHHCLKEWGSPIQPQTNEAWIIYNIENLSAKIMG